MSEFRGTPGPWRGKEIRIHSKFFERYKSSFCFSGRVDSEVEANSNLIMAAPDLLECCIEFVSRTETGRLDGMTDCYLRLKSAINKALGQ